MSFVLVRLNAKGAPKNETTIKHNIIMETCANMSCVPVISDDLFLYTNFVFVGKHVDLRL